MKLKQDSLKDQLRTYTTSSSIFNFLFQDIIGSFPFEQAALCIFEDDELIWFRQHNLEKEAYLLTTTDHIFDIKKYLNNIERKSTILLNDSSEGFLEIFKNRFNQLLIYTIRRGEEIIGGFLVGVTGEKYPEEFRHISSYFNEVSEAIRHKVIFKSETKLLKESCRRRFAFGSLVGKSPAMHKVYDMVEDIAGSDISILIEGETGTGKELLAKTIHTKSHRRNGPFVRAFCSAYTESLIHSELFGHEKGSFTGASKQKKGRFELAENGTLFLDEIGEINPATQVLLLRFLETKEFERVGGEMTQTSNARIVAATNRDLQKRVQQGKFRQDLYFRLNAVTITLPSLREKIVDLPLLIKHFLHQFCRENGKMVTGISPEVMRVFEQYVWPGNVRELKGVLERGFFLTNHLQIELEHLPSHLLEPESNKETITNSPIEKEKEHILSALKQCGGNKKATAQLLGISRPTLYQKIKRFDLVC
ncbi:MAG: sigma-54 dependent transcriptional regulator [Desulfobulbaceae bacterium]|nr:sigma-54 dependent transcriptional regulator [Desulfobulbaceae bacterium]